MSTDARALRLQVVLSAIDRATAPLRGIGKGGKEAAAGLRGTLDELKKLKAQQKSLDSFQQLRDSARSGADQLAAARKRLTELRTAQQAAGAGAQDYAKELAAAEKVVGKLSRAQEAQMAKVHEAQSALKAMGVGTGAAEQRRLAAAIDATGAAADRQRAAMERLAATQRRMRDARAQYDRAIGRAGMLAAGGVATAAAGAAVGAPVLNAVKAYASLEDAMLGIARQVPGARDDAGKLTAVYEQLKAQAHALGREIPLGTTAIAEMMAAGARMEVPTEALADYTRQIARMATAFDAAPAELAEQMGKVAKNFKIPVTQIETLADAINYLDDNAISKGPEIIDVLNRISGVISTVKMSAADAAALSSTLLTLGERPETASTAINAMTTKLAAATKGTKKFKEAVAEIGLDTTRIQAGMAADAMGTLLQVIEAIRQQPESKRIGIMAELVGLEHSDTLAKLVSKPEELARQRQLASSLQAQGSMAREAAARNATLSAQLQMTRNRAFELSTTLGEQLRPALLGVMDSVNSVLSGIVGWAREHPQLTAALVHSAAVLAVLLVGLGGLLVGVAGVLGPLAVMRYSLAIIVPLMGTLAAAIGLPAIALAGLAALAVGAAIVIYQRWDMIKGHFVSIAEAVSSAWTTAMQAIERVTPQWLKDGWAWVKNIASAAANWQGAANQPPIDTRAPLPAGAGAARPVIVQGGPTTIQVSASPGMDERALARYVADELTRRDRELAARGRRSLRDTD